jgi:outer membrane lipoprotein-sorting protein
MRQRIAAFGGIGVAALLGFLLLWGGVETKSLSAMEQMAENVRKAKSYKYISIVRERDPGREPTVSESSVYWLAPGLARTEITRSDSSWKGPGPEVVRIEAAGKPCIQIYRRTKEYRVYPALKSAPYSHGVDKLEDLGRCSGQADRQLGTKEINGKVARGFEIDMAKIYAVVDGGRELKKTAAGDSIPTRKAEIWLDPDSNLPVLVRTTGSKTYLGGSSETEFKEIQWNIDLDPKLFDTTPPEGYKDVTPNLTPDEQVRQIAEFLKLWAETSGGHYPRAAGNLMWKDFAKLFHVAEWRTDPDVRKQYATKCKAADKGFLVLDDIRQYSADFAYYGKAVGPRDRTKVLLRWKLGDGRYEVIFGDLRAETVTAERLRALERK